MTVRARVADPEQGIFGRDSLSWKINRESALFLAAGRAALLQLAHPWVAAALAEHSTTLSEPVTRFHNTFRVMFTMVFGPLNAALDVSRQLHRRHSAIRGHLADAAGPFPAGSSYEANELAALRWVYATLVDSALLAYELILPPLSPDEREQYYRESQTTAALFGIPGEQLPPDWRGFSEYRDGMFASEMLTVTPAARHMAQQLQAGAGSRLRPPGWYRALTVSLLPPRLREQFDLPYGENERQSAARALRRLSRVYPRLPAAVRFVGPYLEALARLQGNAQPTLSVRLSNRLWIGQSALGYDGK